MNRQEKSETIARLQASLDGVGAVVLTSAQKMPVNTLNELRAQLRLQGAHYEVVKNTLIKRAITGTPMENLAADFTGPTAIVYHPEDVTLPSKILLEFQKKNEALVIRRGWLNGTLLDANGVEALSKMPGKDELRAKLLAVFNAVGTQFVRVLAAGPQSFLNVLNARKDTL